jgi:hypothetical protein
MILAILAKNNEIIIIFFIFDFFFSKYCIMSGYMMPPRRSPNDYAIGKATQDELLRIAIANDANIARARKLLKQGQVEELMPRQELSPEERLRDEGVQEAEALNNLLRMGFRKQEASDIVMQLDRDEKATLNGSYPEIKRDLQSNYDIKLITVSFFLAYFRKFKRALLASRGVSFYGAGSGADSLINSVGELESILPSRAQLYDLEQKMRILNMDTRGILYWIENMSPTLYEIRLLSDNLKQRYIQDLLRISQEAGSLSRDQFQTVLDQWNMKILENKMDDGNKINAVGLYYMVRRYDMVSELERLLGDSTETDESAYEDRNLVPVRQVFEELGGEQEEKGKTLEEEEEEDKELVEVKDPKLSDDPLQKYTELLAIDLEKLRNNEIKFDIMRRTLEMSGYELPKSIGRGKFLQNPERYIQQAIDAERIRLGSRSRSVSAPRTSLSQGEGGQDKGGSGIRGFMRPKMKVGRGLTVKKTPAYKEFGKYAIHIPNLTENDKLVVKYKSLGGIPKFKPTQVSDLFRDFILDVFENGKPNKRVFNQLDEDERRLFEDISTGAGLWSGFGLKRTTTSQEEVDDKDFQLLKGEYLAGNNNPQVIIALRRLTVKMINNGRMSKHQGHNLLMELSSV